MSNNQESRISKNLDIKTHFIRSYVEQGIIKILFVKSEGNLEDGFTKSTGEDSYMRSFAYMDDICSDGWHHNKGGCWDILFMISIHV